MKDKSKITLRDIAVDTGLSLNTVSKVVNQKPYYTDETEEKVLKSIKKLGYIPNAIASSLRSGSSRMIGIVFDDLINPYYSVMTLIIAQKLSQAKYDVMMFSNYGLSSFLDKTLLSKLIARKVDAIISFLEPLPEAIDLLEKANTPFLLLGRKVESDRIDCIYSDDYRGGYLAAKHLVECGHKKIAYVGAHPEISADKLRFEGYKQALYDSGIAFEPALTGYFSDYGSIASLTKDFLRKTDADAAVCFNDIFGMGVLQELSSLGYKLPNDYSLVGFDNICKYLSLPNYMTTIGAENEQMAELAVDVLLKKLSGNYSYKTLLRKAHPVKLIRGGSTRPVKNKL